MRENALTLIKRSPATAVSKTGSNNRSGLNVLVFVGLDISVVDLGVKTISVLYLLNIN